MSLYCIVGERILAKIKFSESHETVKWESSTHMGPIHIVCQCTRDGSRGTFLGQSSLSLMDCFRWHLGEFLMMTFTHGMLWVLDVVMKRDHGTAHLLSRHLSSSVVTSLRASANTLGYHVSPTSERWLGTSCVVYSSGATLK